MADSTLDVTQPFDRPQKLLRITDNGDSTYSIAVSASSLPLPSGGATAANQALELTELRSINLLSSVVYDTILVTYTDATKATISKVEWKLAGNVIKTLTDYDAVLAESSIKHVDGAALNAVLNTSIPAIWTFMTANFHDDNLQKVRP